MQALTRDIAREVVQKLRTELSSHSPENLSGVRSLFVYGSFMRGDWLDSSSDLDLGVLFSPGSSQANSTGYQTIQDAATRILAGRCFPSHTPGGIDWCTLPSFPTRDEEVRRISAFPPFNIFMFDFMRYSDILWGEDFRSQMPAPPDPASLALPWFHAILARLDELGDSPLSRQKAPFNAYKALMLTQLVFGERTRDKTKILHLYMNNVPDFPMKSDGEKLIRQYLGATYPDRPPAFEEPSYYRRLIEQFRDMVQNRDEFRTTRHIRAGEV